MWSSLQGFVALSSVPFVEERPLSGPKSPKLQPLESQANQALNLKPPQGTLLFCNLRFGVSDLGLKATQGSLNAI